GDEDRRQGHRAERAFNARAIEGGLDVCVRIRADSHYFTFVCNREPDGLAVHSADANFCGEGFEGRSAYTGFSDGGDGSGSAGFGRVAGSAKNSAGTWQDDSAFRRSIWNRANLFRAIAKPLDIACTDVGVRFWADAPNGRKQYHHSNDCRGK